MSVRVVGTNVVYVVVVSDTETEVVVVVRVSVMVVGTLVMYVSSVVNVLVI